MVVRIPNLVLLGAAPLTFVACVAVGTRPVKTEEKLLRESTEEVAVDGPGKPTAVVEGTTLRLRAVALCQRRSVRHLDRVETRERYMNSGAYPWYVGGLGLTAATAGSIGLIDASNVYGDDTNARTYNPEGQDKAFLANGALLATGLAAGTLLLIDIVRASGTVETTSAVEVPAEPTGDEFPCTRRVLRNEPVWARADDVEAPLGSTGVAGKLEVDLDTALPASFAKDELPILMRKTVVLTVDVSALQRAREENLWKTLGLDECRAPAKANSCQSVEAFLVRFPAGVHAAEARDALDGARAALARIRDQDEWAAVDMRCTQAAYSSSDEGTQACLPLQQYLENHPDGVHAGEATQILASARRKIAQLRSSEEAAVRKAEADAEASERAEQRALLDQCQARCRNECRQPNFDDKAMCMRGCYAFRCAQGDECAGGCNMSCAENRYYGDHEGCFRDCRTSRGCRK